MRLFIERAQAVQPSFAVTRGNAPTVAQVCFHLAGIPLALKLAAAWVRSLSVEEINTRLDHRFRLLTEPERILLQRLSVFAGGWALGAAEGVCSGDADAIGDIEGWKVLDLLTGLVDKFLAVYEEGADGAAGRCRQLESVRQYAGDRQGTAGTLIGLGMVASAQDDYAEARVLYGESLTMTRQPRDRRVIAHSLEGMTGVAQGQS